MGVLDETNTVVMGRDVTFKEIDTLKWYAEVDNKPSVNAAARTRLEVIQGIRRAIAKDMTV